jgi:ribokinase
VTELVGHELSSPAIADGALPLVVVGAHSQSLFMHVSAIPREGETVAAHGFEETLDGGKATNQAVAAARLGAPVRFLSLVGDDERGRRILRYLHEQGVDTRWVGVADGPTDVGFVLLPPSRIPAIASCDDLSVRLDHAFVSEGAAAIKGASIVVCQLEAPPACAITAFTLARAGGARTLLNPAPAVLLPSELLRLTDILVPNEHEAAVLIGREGPVADRAHRLADMVPWASIVVTAGSDGAYLARAGSPTEHIQAPVVASIDTTGAGDAFVGALAAQLRAGMSVTDAARFAVVAAAVSVTHAGTLRAFATAEDVAAHAGR